MTRYEPHCDCLGGHVSMVPDPNGRWCRADDMAGRYRLLTTRDRVEPGDQSLRDDCITWGPVDRWATGMNYAPMMLMPIRRPIPTEADHD